MKINKKLTPEEKAQKKAEVAQKRIQRKFRSDVKAVFLNAGFKSIAVTDVHFNFLGRTSELDNLFISENVLIICEDTYKKEPGEHLVNKKIIFDLISSNPENFVEFLCSQFPAFKEIFESKKFKAHHYEIRIAYFSRYPVEQEHKNQCKQVKFFDYPRFRYFSSLAKITGKTSRFELFKFFNINYSDIGEKRLNKSLGATNKRYEGFLLPEDNSNYPAGYKVLSFYMDPKTLLEKSYVLRKDSWEDPDSAYQRMLEHKKIRSMRKYLNATKRVYVNNLIVTLPSTATFFSPKDDCKLNPNDLMDNQHVKIQLPDEFNTIGLIDGQHRVYSYHEGSDTYEETISGLRTCQNLLVTALMYPDGINELERTKFEATLFLEINNEQTKARGDLKQAIELIVTPFSTTAISKAIISRLAKSGPLKNLLEEHYFDEEYKIKTSSIVSYGLKPLVKFNGDDTLFKVWDNEKKNELLEEKNKDILNQYLDFCAQEINNLLLGAKLNLLSKWSLENKELCILSPTTINGFIVCLRELIKAGSTHDVEYYKARFADIDAFNFKNYKSSHWKQLGVTLHTDYFS